MKKLLFVAFWTLAAGSLTPRPAAALWPFDCCCHKCLMTIQCKQYNAFSPFCCDSACFNGCHGGPKGCMPLHNGYAYPPGGPGAFNGYDGAILAQDGIQGCVTDGAAKPNASSTTPATPTAPMPAPKAPAPANQASQMWPGMAPYGMAPYGMTPYGMIQQTGYRGYYPGYAPQYNRGYAAQYNRGYGYPYGYGYAPQYNTGYAGQYGMPSNPWYWGNGGR